MTGQMTGPAAVRRLASEQLATAEIAQIRDLMRLAFAEDEHGGFTDDDWQHALGGVHFVLDVERAIISHAAVVERELQVDGVPIRTGYVEAVATAPDQQRRGYGTAVMGAVAEHLAEHYELGALGTGSQGFYERLGWQTWRGPSHVRTDAGLVRTADEDGYILVLLTLSSPDLDLTAPISCEWRPGDVW